MDRCDLCQRMKKRMETLVRKLIANKVSEKLQTYLIVDFITKLLLIVEKNAISVVYIKLLKMIYFVATTEETLVERLTMLFRNNIQFYPTLLYICCKIFC